MNAANNQNNTGSWRPTISVVLCTFNGAPYLPAQLDSIRRQTYPIYEVLAFDDGSTDGTLDILDRYAATWPALKVHRNAERLGFNGNFQQALLAATGDAIAISDQDDIWMKEKLEKCVAIWDPKCPLVYCDSMRFEGEVPEVPKRSHHNIFFSGNDARKLLFANTVSGHAMIVRRDFLPKVLPFREGIFYDWWMAFIAADNGGVAFLDEPLVLHRIHEKNASGHKETTRREALVYHRNDTIRHLRHFKDAPNVRPEILELGARFLDLFTDRKTTARKIELLRLILQNWEVFFYYRRRKKNMNAASIFKYAARWAFYD
ncbi:MAG: glycosyltransferase [Chitinophagaceae bacterium]|nr:MAG: glycosyltransferase [Chitinophagaceae bacterium]